ncbi:hypothetical protein [Pseudomonas sp. TWP3-1]|uniref:hypothetical protein n=1 Tax=Pseudomonas sp. TWP3-1 TaxID=2804631 RepID=UPI003CF4EEF6
MAHLVVSKDTGELLFDTDLISYGLIKSGYLAYSQSWTRRMLRSIHLDPNNGANWFPVVVTVNESYDDRLHGFTVANAICPVVFLVGPGTLSGTSRSGNTMTFLYANAETSTRFYCFDLMADNIPGSPYLKTWDPTGRITFNSLQPPMNVVAAIQAPGPGALDFFGRYKTCYANGYNQSVSRPISSRNNYSNLHSKVNIPLSPGVEYAAYLPWSRGVGINDLFPYNGYDNFSQYGGNEGAYGYVGGISFMFGVAPGTTSAGPSVANQVVPCSFFNLPTDRYPVALVIQTSSYPFPYG